MVVPQPSERCRARCPARATLAPVGRAKPASPFPSTLQALSLLLPFVLLSLCFSLSLFRLCSLAHGVSVPPPGIELRPPAVKVPSPNHWTARQFPSLSSFSHPSCSVKSFFDHLFQDPVSARCWEEYKLRASWGILTLSASFPLFLFPSAVFIEHLQHRRLHRSSLRMITGSWRDSTLFRASSESTWPPP